jgi:pimeloyl-ACP methyl ester carboxylesterase
VKRHELVRPDTTIRYWAGGHDAGPALVFLHGATLDHRSWEAQVNALRSRYRVVVPDLRAHGESCVDGPFAFGAAVDDVIALLDALELDHLAIVGLSLGGNIAQELVHRDPARATALVVADATCNTSARHPWQTSMAIATLAGLGMVGRDLFLHATAHATARNADVQRYVLEMNAVRSTQATLQILRAMLDEALHPDPAYRLPIPTLLMHGDGDQFGDIVAGTKAWADGEPLAEYLTIPHARHVSNQDNPEVFNAALTSFLDRALPSVGTGGARTDFLGTGPAARS